MTAATPTADDLMTTTERYVRECFRSLGFHNEEAAIRRLTRKLAEDMQLEIAVTAGEREAGFAED